jgi:hypothetical protein
VGKWERKALADELLQVWAAEILGLLDLNNLEDL